MKKLKKVSGKNFLTNDVLNLINSASNDETRQHLNGIYIDLEECKAIATCGFQLAMVSFELPKKFKDLDANGFTIGVDTVKSLKKILKNEFVAMNITLTIDINLMAITIKTIDECFTHKLVDGDFADYKRIIPTNRETSEAYCISPRLIEKVRKSFGIKANQTSGLIFHLPTTFKVAGEGSIIDALKPCLVTYNDDSGFKKEAVIMPMRID